MGSTNSCAKNFNIKTSFENDSYSLNIIYDRKETLTEPYKKYINVIRRGTYFFLQFKIKKTHQYNNIDVIVKTSTGPCPITEVICNDNKDFPFLKILKEVKRNSKEYLFSIDFDINSPVGFYELYIVDGKEKITDNLPFFIIFNPLNESDDTYTPSNDIINKFLLDKTTFIHYGSEENYFLKKYKLKQFSIQCLLVSWECLCRMNITDRKNPMHVSKYLSEVVHSNDGIGILSQEITDILNGTHPSIWTNMGDIYREYLIKKLPVDWGNYFICAVLITSLCRCIGIICRTVTGFSINPNITKDGIITIILSEDDLTTIQNSASLWNFHCWNNVMIKSNVASNIKPFKNAESSWHHLDIPLEYLNKGTSNNNSNELLLMKIDSSKCDRNIGSFIHSSLNAKTKYIINNQNDKKQKEFYKKTCGKLFLTSCQEKHSIDISYEYKELQFSNKIDCDDNKLSVLFKVDSSIHMGDRLKYNINIRNSSDGHKSLVCICVQFRNQHDINMPFEEKYRSFEFKDKNIDLNEEFELIPLIDKIDISQMCYFWELRFLDHIMNKLKIIRKTTLIQPLFSADIITFTRYWSSYYINLMISVKNKSKYLLKDVKILIHYEKDKTIYKEFIQDFKPGETNRFWAVFKKIPIGNAKFLAIASHGFTVQLIGGISRYVIY